MSDFGLSNDNLLGDFAGMDLVGILGQLGGSAGGTWLDLSALPIRHIGYVRLSLADEPVQPSRLKSMRLPSKIGP